MIKTTLLIDADIFCYHACCANETKFDFGDTGQGKTVGDIRVAKKIVGNMIRGAMMKLEAEDLVICLSCPTADGFRRKILPSYKMNRTQEKPEQLQELKDYLAEKYPSYMRDGLEADDVMGILSTHPTLIKGRRVIVSIDKDMESIPGFLYNPNKDNHIRSICEEDADKFHMIQTLTGDSVDGYKGCPDVGIVGATKLLEGLKSSEYWTRVEEAFVMAGLTEEDALVQARVARICRYTDYDFNKKEVILWKPKDA